MITGMSYPPRPQLRALPQFLGTAAVGTRADPALVDFVLAQYRAGRSLREIADLTDRSFSTIRKILNSRGVPRRERGAPQLAERHTPRRARNVPSS
jgi:hypothetical protein